MPRELEDSTTHTNSKFNINTFTVEYPTTIYNQTTPNESVQMSKINNNKPSTSLKIFYTILFAPLIIVILPFIIISSITHNKKRKYDNKALYITPTPNDSANIYVNEINMPEYKLINNTPKGINNEMISVINKKPEVHVV